MVKMAKENVDASFEAVKDGKIKEKQIDESVKRILILKLNRKIIK